MGKVSKKQRSKIMSHIRSKDTAIELRVRRLAHRLGYRFRLHRKDLPGKPDLVFPARNKVIFVHGCFWHVHDCPHGMRKPQTNKGYWEPKLRRNQERDRRQIASLEEQGWKVLVIWECETDDLDELALKLRSFLG